MRLLSWLLCAAAAILPVLTSEEKSISRPKRDSSEKKIVCYYTNWSVYRPGSAKYTPQNINPYLCTHLIYAFGGLSKDNALKPFDKYQDIEQGGYAKFNGLKTYNKKLKTMLAIGGWNEGSVRFSPLVADAERRKELVKNTVRFLRQNHFDGLDLDWEYPSFRDGGKPRDRDNYATLVQEFREEFERESEKTGRPRLLLTMAVPAGIEYIDKGYDIPKLNKYLDWMNILSYDYHSAFEPAINHHSPLFSLEEDDEYNFDAQLNIDHTVQHYIKLGASRNKLVLGIPTYGRSYTLFNPDATEIGSPADGPGEQGEATREKGYLAYYEICERVRSGGWALENPNPEAMGPYAYKDNQWVGFDDVDIVKAKAKYVNDNDLGGIMFWSIDNDDFRGKCHDKPYPLIEAAKETLLASANDLPSSSRKETKQEQESAVKTKARKSRLRTKPSTTTESSKVKGNGLTTTTPQPPTTPDPGSDFVCKDEGFFPHPRDCKKYFWCLDSGPSSLGIVAHQFTCPSGLVFNKISDSCDYARNVICKTKSEPSTTSTTTTTTTTTYRTTTARNRIVITASPPRSTTTTTTTTTESPDEEEEEEEEDEEDPGTIKELIQLIKKLGGVEQLEKQLNLQSGDGKEKIKPSLYSRVLQGRAQNRYRGVSDETTTQKYVSAFRNRPVKPQSPSAEEITTPARSLEKPRYVTIQRHRPTKKPTAEEETEEEEEDEQGEELKPKVETPRSFRRRPAVDTTSEKEYVTLRRPKPQKEDEITTQKYKNIVRVRSTTKAPTKEEEEEEEEEEKEDEKALEEEEEIIEEDRGEEEEELEENEPGQKLKKYSAIVRDNKKQIPEEKESKVSGPQGPRNEYEESNTARDSILTGKDNVNTVNIKSSPIYTEIRRKQSTASPSDVNVNSVNILQEDEKNKGETNEVSENETENKDKDFQKRITTEIIRTPTKSTLTTPTQSRKPATTEQSRHEDNKVSTVRERFIANPVTDSTLTTKLSNPYELLKKINNENPVYRHELIQSPQKEKKFESSTVAANSNSDKYVTEAPRKFQFAPRKRPNILLQKPLDSITEVSQITVPDFPSDTLPDNTLGSFFSSATTKLSTVNEILEAATDSNTPRNNEFLTTFKEKLMSTSTQRSVPSTSTQTTVVTSITESSITERRRILVPKKSLFKPTLVTLRTAYESPEETTTPLPRFSGYRTIVRSTTPKIESKTDSKIRRFKFKSTTTEAPVAERKFVPKQKKTFRRTTTEEPEKTSTATERFRLRTRDKPRQTEGSPVERNGLLQARINYARRKKLLSKKEDDLDVEQTATFFDEFDGNDRVILGGAIKQTSEKDYLNADVYFRSTPVKENSSGVSTVEDVDSLELNKIAVTPFNSNSQSPVPRTNLTNSRFVRIDPVFRNLRSRARNANERNLRNENIRRVENSPSNKNAFTANFQTFRNRNTNKNGSEKFSEKTDEVIETEGKDGPDTEEPKKIKTSLQRNSRIRAKNKASGSSENLTNTNKAKSSFDERLDIEQQIRNNIFPQRPNQSNSASSRSRTKQILQTNENVSEGLLSETALESPGKNQLSSDLNDTEEKRTQIFSLKNQGGDRLRQKTTELPLTNDFNLPNSSTKLPTFATQRLRLLKGRTEDAIKRSEPTTESPNKDFSFESKKYEPVTGEIESSVSETTNPSVRSTFGAKIGSTIGSPTDFPANFTFGTKIAPTLISTESLTTGSNMKSFPTESTIATFAVEEENKRSRKTKENEFTKSPTSSDIRIPRTKARENQGSKQSTGNKTDASRLLRARGKVKAVDSLFQATEGNAVTETENRSGRVFFPKDRRKVLVRTRLVQPSPEPDEEENALEPPEEVASKTASDKRVNQETVTDFRTRSRFIQSPPTTEQANKRRTQLDRRRFRGESRTSTEKPEVQTETSVTVSKSSILLRRRLRPTTTTTTTTEKPYIEQVEDSSLEESKSLDETPDIQDLADPAVVAIHYLATVSPGPGASSVTPSVNPNSYSQTSDTYTVHVTPSDIASFSTPKLSSVTPGSPVSLRPTSILTLKPYTTPLITKQYAPKQSPSPFRAPPFRGEKWAGIPLVTEEPYSPRSEILIQSRKQDPTQRAKPKTSVISAASQKAAEPKSRRLKPFSKVPKQEVGQAATSSEPPVDYEYYDDDNDPLANIPASALKVKVHSDGYIECLDRGNFPHPFSCKKFISCAKMENNELLGWEYTCPKHLSFDPVGGICNWSAGLGCQH